MQPRTLKILQKTLNQHRFSEDDCYWLFCFRLRNIEKMVDIWYWASGKTKRYKYVVDTVTSICVVLRKLSYPTRWRDVEGMFGVHTSAIREVFWEVVESLVHKHGHLLKTFWAGVMNSRAEMYVKAIRGDGTPLNNVMEFINCTTIQICRLGGRGFCQRVTYSGHKRSHWLIYQTVTTPDGPMYYMYSSKVERNHEMTLHHECSQENVLEVVLVIT